MEYVKMPELMSSEALKVLFGNVEAVKGLVGTREHESSGCDNDECCCPKKVKFIIVFSNVAIFNINAVCEE